MAIGIPRGKSDKIIEHIVEVLRAYDADHPSARIDLYRHDLVSVRVRIVDPAFAGQSKVQRSREAWKYLDALPDHVHSDLSALILLTPDETQMSGANLEFEDPVPFGV